MVQVRSRVAAIAASLAVAVSLLVAAAAPASAQSCPTTGGGTTCFGGQRYCPANGQCYEPPTSCSGGQVMDCNACGCVCPSGTTLCTTSGQCVTNRACPAGTSWDPCTDTCGTPYVLLSPPSTQNGFIKVSGDLTLTAGDVRLEQASGAGQGELYFANGKAVHVDGSGTTGLSFVNAVGSGLDLNLPASTRLCFGASCRNSWPTTTDFDPAYVNVGGDTMSGLLTLGGGLRMSSGAAAGKVLTSDATGNATWQPLSGIGGSGTAGRLPKFTTSSTLGDSSAVDTGVGLSIPGLASSGAYGLSVANNGTGGGIDVSTNSGLNGIPALRVTNAGAGRGLEVQGGSSGNGAFIMGAGSNVALEAASYNYPGSSAIGTVMQVRRGVGSGIAPAAGMGARIGFPLQSDSAGSYSQGGGLGAIVETASPWKTGLFFETVNGSTQAERMRLTGDGRLGIGTSSPGALLSVGSGAMAGGALAGVNVGVPGAAYVQVSDGSRSAFLGADSSGYGMVGTLTNADFVVRSNNAERVRVAAGGNVGIGATAPGARLSVGGNGTNVYATDLWVENNLHVQGNESVGSGRGRLRVGTAWNIPGIYAETNSVGQVSDLVLGASSDHVLINAGSFGRPGNSAVLELWGSRIQDTGSGTLSIRSGGSVVRFDGGDNVIVDNSLQLGGVARSSWPSLATTTSYCQFNAGSGAGWKACYCPSGYEVTGWYGYNCKSNGGEWECSSSAPYGSTAVQVYHDSAGTAYVWAQCARVN